ncbi:uncharacterized protein PITG_10103 [Phytophthora infestans T30-4]|uniref:Uncharacterized protein n=1 Tax=Phytophthora infestans (strain T30-4) TaxID=403677 RepID=D0NEB2_PHYIT|nr:uncharacterized protein PITG_10103 [Phytophthora infestans T30-4]EEY56557.1 conserved hypothetical protein [Phytophthora infestans T30-4]|eukprot:XP_002902631.1 conserved hypothetical protein [Phytophthora infestans T30-4]
MTAWLALHFPQTIDSITKKMLIPLPKEAILVFLGHICSPAHMCDRDKVCAQDTSKLRRVLKGYEKVINDLKKRGLMKINEGKRQLKGSGFELLALKLMKLEPVKKGQAWSTVLFGWRFFDCLIVEEQGHKGDQIGAEKFGKHVYSNPYTPSQSPVLALAVLLFCCPERGSFGRLLRRVIKSLGEEELCILGCIPEDIGTHSLRKGSSSYALGQLKDRYIHFGEGADQLCGRMIAELPFDSECFGSAFPFLIASLIHHEHYLRVTLSSSHPIFKARVFIANSLLDDQRGVTILAIGTSPVK